MSAGRERVAAVLEGVEKVLSVARVRYSTTAAHMETNEHASEYSAQAATKCINNMGHVQCIRNSEQSGSAMEHVFE